MRKKPLFLVCATLCVAAIILFLTKNNFGAKSTPPPSKASSSTALITSQAEWQSGTDDGNVDYSSSAGSIKINGETQHTAGTYSIDTPESQDVSKAHDSNLSTYVFLYGNGVDTFYGITYDLGSTQTVSKIKYYGTIELAEGYNGSTWATICSAGTGGCDYGDEWNTATVGAQYSKIAIRVCGMGAYNIYEYQVYVRPTTATHTSATNQITNTNLYQWQTFTPTYTAPANTTVSFRLRTSTDANTWTSWTAYQTPNSGSSLDITSLVTSSTGDAGSETFYKYIQVETKLTSSDGTSTPTVDDYSIGYHTNVVPNKPTGGTVTMGE